MALAAVSLDDKYALQSGRVYLTGTQALVRLPIMQRIRDAAQGLNTAGFISGYRGSPLGSLDIELWRGNVLVELIASNTENTGDLSYTAPTDIDTSVSYFVRVTDPEKGKGAMGAPGGCEMKTLLIFTFLLLKMEIPPAC